MENAIMQSYQNTVNNGPTERSQTTPLPIDETSWESVAELEEFLREKYTSYPTVFSKSLLPDLLSSSDDSARCAEIAPRSGEFYSLNASRSDDPISSEDCVDIDRLLISDNLDERPAGPYGTAAKIAATAARTDHDPYNVKSGDSDNFANHLERVADPSAITPTTATNQLNNMYKRYNNISDLSNYTKSEYTIKKEYISCNNNNINNGYNSASTSACQSPTNVLSMEGSPIYPDYLLLDATDVTSESVLGGVNSVLFEEIDSIIPGDDKLVFDFAEFRNPIGKRHHYPPLTLNLKGSFVNNEEINTPNIIESIMAASEQPLIQFIPSKEENFDQLSPPNFTPALEELTPLPSTSTSSPAAASDTTDSFLTSITSTSSTTAPPIARKRGRPRKRHHDSDDEPLDDERDDETYVPPLRVKLQKRQPRAVAATKRFVYEDISEDEDYESKPEFSAEAQRRLQPLVYEEDEIDEDEEHVSMRRGRRGRPPKHTRSISSDDYVFLEPQEAKYREMRDRNNEASRKSRYKRKQKEIKLSDELEDLELENVKLKAQVEELQKTVERYRDNLMQVMLSKK